jgi:hypothetical protein
MQREEIPSESEVMNHRRKSRRDRRARTESSKCDPHKPQNIISHTINLVLIGILLDD